MARTAECEVHMTDKPDLRYKRQAERTGEILRQRLAAALREKEALEQAARRAVEWYDAPGNLAVSEEIEALEVVLTTAAEEGRPRTAIPGPGTCPECGRNLFGHVNYCPQCANALAAQEEKT